MANKKAGKPKEKSKTKLDKDSPEFKKEFAKVMISPSGTSAFALEEMHDRLSWSAVRAALRDINENTFEGDLKMAEAMLMDQAMVLQTIFATHSRAMVKTETISSMEAYGRIALRAQNQCQRTLRTLLEYKNPKRATFIKQQNNLQINEAENSEKKVEPANELLEIDHESRLDTGTSQEASRGNQEVETVGEIDRAEDKGR